MSPSQNRSGTEGQPPDRDALSAPPPRPPTATDPPHPNRPHPIRLTRIPTKRVRREADGTVTVPLWLQRDGRFDMDLPLCLSPAEAETLHAQLCYALDTDPAVPVTTPADAAPDCRKKVLGDPRNRPL